jgi:hypothetical protein
MAGHGVSLRLRDVRHAVGFVYANVIRRIDGPPKRIGQTGRVVVLNTVEHNLITLHEVIDVHAQMCRAGVADELRGEPSAEIARPPPAGTARELHADADAGVP